MHECDLTTSTKSTIFIDMGEPGYGRAGIWASRDMGKPDSNLELPRAMPTPVSGPAPVAFRKSVIGMVRGVGRPASLPKLDIEREDRKETGETTRRLY